MRDRTAIDFDNLTRALLPAVLQAGRTEMAHFEAGVAVERKADKSPVTVADREAEAIVVEALARIAPDIPVIAEEAVSAGAAPPVADRYFLVDALDGTRWFVKGSPEFSINVGLVVNGSPVYGMIYGPAIGRLYLTRTPERAEWAPAPPALSLDVDDLLFLPLGTREPDMQNLVAFNSRSGTGRTSGLLNDLAVKDARPYGSSLKFCLIAAGEGDFYARLGDTNEWDTAAGQAILESAGGIVTTLDGERLVYGRSGSAYRNPNFVAWGRRPLKIWSGAG
jgi:3'(2'), 5'-bisphosphate nucleotidase